MLNFAYRPLNAFDVSRRNSTLGFLPFYGDASLHADVVVSETFLDGITAAANVTQSGSGAVFNDGVSFSGNDNSIKFDFSASGFNVAAALHAGFQMRFELSKAYINYYDIDDNDTGRIPAAFEYIASWNAEGADGVAANARTILGVTPLASDNATQLRLTPEGGTARNFRLIATAFADPEWATVHIWGDATNYWMSVDGQLLLDGVAHGLASGDMSFLWLGSDRAVASQSGMDDSTPNTHKIRNFQVAKVKPVFGSLPTNYIGFFGDSYVNGARYDYTSGVWTGNADSYNGRLGLQISALLRLEYGIDFQAHMHADGGGHHITGTIDPALFEDIGTYTAQNCHFTIFQASTNDAKLAAGIPDTYELWLRKCIDTLMGTSNAKGLLMSNTPSLAGRSRAVWDGSAVQANLDTAQYRAQVEQINRVTARVSDWWDTTYPARRGRVQTCDIFTPLGGVDVRLAKTMVGDTIGENASGVFGDAVSVAHSGQLGKRFNDLHPNAEGYRIMAREAYWPALKSLIQRFG